mgnify:CR=1 FL=1
MKSLKVKQNENYLSTSRSQILFVTNAPPADLSGAIGLRVGNVGNYYRRLSFYLGFHAARNKKAVALFKLLAFIPAVNLSAVDILARNFARAFDNGYARKTVRVKNLLFAVKLKLRNVKIITLCENFTVFARLVLKSYGSVFFEIYYVHGFIDVKFAKFTVRSAAIVIVNPVS